MKVLYRNESAEVMQFVVTGMMNKEIAAKLELSEITIKVHRGQAMRKMKAKSLADLVRMADRLRSFNPAPSPASSCNLYQWIIVRLRPSRYDFMMTTSSSSHSLESRPVSISSRVRWSQAGRNTTQTYLSIESCGQANVRCGAFARSAERCGGVCRDGGEMRFLCMVYVLEGETLVLRASVIPT